MRWTVGALLLVGCGGRGCGNDNDDTSNDCTDAERRTWYADQDGDGHGDGLSTVEACAQPDGAVLLDDDCDDTDPSAIDLVEAYADEDGDGFGAGDAESVCEGSAGWSAVAGDCDDDDPAVSPAENAVCGNDLDDDCDGLPDCAVASGTLAVSEAPGVRFYGEGEAAFGAALLAPGDVDGDGIADLVIGAPELDGMGAALVFHGPFTAPRGMSEADLQFYALMEGHQAGRFLAAGQLDEDQDLDLVVGVPEGVPADGGGGIYVGHGPFVADVPLTESPVLDYFSTGTIGVLVSGEDCCGEAGDELLVGSNSLLYILSEPEPESGNVDDDSWGELDFNGGGPISATFTGDLNADGAGDVAAGAVGRDANITETGEERWDAGLVAVVLDAGTFRRRENASDAMDVGLGGEATDSLFGHALAAAGDVNQDGYADLLVSAPGQPGWDGEDEAGAVYLFSGAEITAASGSLAVLAAETAAVGILVGDEGDLAMGTTIAGDLDVDGDGAADLAAGAPGADDAAGAVFVWQGTLTGEHTAADAGLRLDGIEAGDQLGAALVGAGDLNGLGWDDLVVGAPGADGGDGAVWLLEMDGL